MLLSTPFYILLQTLGCHALHSDHSLLSLSLLGRCGVRGGVQLGRGNKSDTNKGIAITNTSTLLYCEQEQE